MSYNRIAQKLKILNTKAPKSKFFVFKFISEKRGRDWRFQCLARLYLAKNYTLLFTGHTATDRAETTLLQLIRGTSLYGLTSFRLQKSYKSFYPKYYNYSNFFTRKLT